MQDPNEDTEWNDVLRSKGILPPKQKEAEITEEQIQSMLNETIEKHTGLQTEEGSSKHMEKMTLDELDELEDSEDEAVLEQYRQKRIAELRALSQKNLFGSVTEITGQEYVQEVTKAGEGIWVVIHLYANGVPQCSLINHFMNELATRFPTTKFLRSIATTCIPNFPERNTPSIFIYCDGKVHKQFLGPSELRGDKLTIEEFEYMLGMYGAIETDIKEDPKVQIRDKMLADLELQRSDDFY